MYEQNNPYVIYEAIAIICIHQSALTLSECDDQNELMT